MVFPHFHSAEKDSLLDNKTSSSASYDDYDKQHREVKIKITKEKLEELLGTADVHGMSVDQVVLLVSWVLAPIIIIMILMVILILILIIIVLGGRPFKLFPKSINLLVLLYMFNI